MPSRLGSIHVATTKRFYKDRLYQTHLLRRSYREGPQVKHETLGNISHLPTDLIDLIKRSLAGEKFVSASEAFTIERSLPHGHVEAVLGTMAKLGIDTVIFSKRCRQTHPSPVLEASHHPFVAPHHPGRRAVGGRCQ